MPSGKREYKESNVNYLNKDFDSFKANLIEYAKTYFPNSYKDFNETSPGMMLIEMSAYVGDVLSYYIDQQYKEMMLPLAQERRNIVNISKMLGYKVKPTIPAYVDLTITQTVDATDDINDKKPDYTDTVVIDKGLQIQSSDDSNVIFETLEPVDFTVSSSMDSSTPPEETGFDDDGIVNEYTLTRKVRAISGESKSKDFTVGSPQQYLKLTLPDEDVIEVISVEDVNNGGKWYEVDYLAQDKVHLETFYQNDTQRTSAYSYYGSEEVVSVAVPYALKYIKTGKRFITEVGDDNKTALVFGNGVLRRGEGTLDTTIQDSADIHVITPGDPATFGVGQSLDPRSGDSRMTLGETPGNTTLRVTYRTGGGISANAAAGSLVTQINTAAKYLKGSRPLTVDNEDAAFGGSDQESVEEIRHKAKQFFATQNRCVTKEDFEARVLSMPPRLGNVAKVYAQRNGVNEIGSSLSTMFNNLDVDGTAGFSSADLDQIVSWIQTGTNTSLANASGSLEAFQTSFNQHISNIGTDAFATIDLYILGYDNNKNLEYLPYDTNGVTHPLKQNIKEYLENFRMLTDQINITDGKVINFGVAFEVVAHRSANKQDVKLRCIDTITDYFDIDNMQFRDTIYTSDLEYQLMGLEGVRSVNWIQLTQNFNDLYDESIDGLPSGLQSLYNQTKDYPDGGATGNEGYGWKYPFKNFYNPAGSGYVAKGVVLPSVDPAVFELKFPNENIRGVVL